MSITRDLLVGLKAELTAAGFMTPGFYKELPTAPDRAYAISTYASADEPKVALSHIRVQFFFRGAINDSLTPDDDADAVFAVLQGLENRTYGSVQLVQCLRVSAIPLGIDTVKRTMRSDNYELDVDLPTTAGRPF